MAACITHRTAVSYCLHLEATILSSSHIPFIQGYRYIKNLSEETSCRLSWWSMYVIPGLDLGSWSRKIVFQPGLHSKTTIKPIHFLPSQIGKAHFIILPQDCLSVHTLNSKTPIIISGFTICFLLSQFPQVCMTFIYEK